MRMLRKILIHSVALSLSAGNAFAAPALNSVIQSFDDPHCTAQKPDDSSESTAISFQCQLASGHKTIIHYEDGRAALEITASDSENIIFSAPFTSGFRQISPPFSMTSLSNGDWILSYFNYYNAPKKQWVKLSKTQACALKGQWQMDEVSLSKLEAPCTTLTAAQKDHQQSNDFASISRTDDQPSLIVYQTDTDPSSCVGLRMPKGKTDILCEGFQEFSLRISTHNHQDSFILENEDKPPENWQGHYPYSANQAKLIEFDGSRKIIGPILWLVKWPLKGGGDNNDLKAVIVPIQTHFRQADFASNKAVKTIFYEIRLPYHHPDCRLGFAHSIREAVKMITTSPHCN